MFPLQTERCGWGAVALEPLEKGDFVIEYVGEGKVCFCVIILVENRSGRNSKLLVDDLPRNICCGGSQKKNICCGGVTFCYVLKGAVVHANFNLLCVSKMISQTFHYQWSMYP